MLALNSEGDIITSLQDTRGDELGRVTAVRTHDGRLYCASLYHVRLGRLPLNAVPGLDDHQ
ncbi:MAG: hypothetical protein ACOCVV_02825 [Marinobacter sp.]